jgi:hypothetical protein
MSPFLNRLVGEDSTLRWLLPFGKVQPSHTIPSERHARTVSVTFVFQARLPAFD